MRVTGKEEACPQCGKKFEKGVKFKCPSCGGLTSNRWRKCPICQADLTVVSSKATTQFEDKARGEPKPEVEGTSTTPEALVDEAIPIPQPEVTQQATEITPQTKKTPRIRKIKSERVTTLDYGVKPSDRGLSNGVGHVNGRGRVNGTGTVNERAFVNGTGISNGLGPRSREIPSERSRRQTKWQLLAVLLAIVIIIPAFVILSYSNKTDEFSIDGNFAEWEGATTYGTRIPSTSPSSNITEWAVGTQSSDLFFYVQTQANMMSSPDAESYYLFVDSDGSNKTGYIMESIGADYMLELTGWDSAVKSSSLFEYSSSSDHYDWNSWVSIGSLSHSLDLARIEAGATMPVTLGESAKFVLVSKDSLDRGSVSYTAPLKGGVLIVRQATAPDVAAFGTIPRAASAAILTLTFTCEGKGGQVSHINPALAGAQLASQEPAFTLNKGDAREITIAVDTSSALDGQLVSAEVFKSSIVSTFACVEIIGSGASAYAGSPPSGIAIDGAFADWTGRLSVDRDAIPVTNPSVDINEVGNLSTSQNSFFYVSVEGELCSGAFVPAVVAKPSGAGGGGVVIPTRHTAEDILSIYVDSDKSSSTGAVVTLNSKTIGADQKIEVKGLFGNITSMKGFDFSSSSGTWVEIVSFIDAAKDEKRIEIAVSAASLGGSSDIDFIVETTSWKGRGDLAMFDPSSMRASTSTWIVEPVTSSQSATSMSYQRKMFYDGVNYWSFFFNGNDTECKYSMNDGQTWVYSGLVFTTPGVDETSIWYDPSTSTVYAIGDIPLATSNVTIQVGIVDASAHSISWAANDSSLTTSSLPLAGKNTYISKDTNGYLWVLSSNCTSDKPRNYWLDAFKSRNVNDTGSWVDTGQLLPWYLTTDNAKGSIVPAGSGSDVWAVYIYGGYVSARKYNGTWQADQRIYTSFGSTANTDNSPPSVVVDKRGVVHVVCGTGEKVGGGGGISTPRIWYSHNDTDLTTFTGVFLDTYVKGVGGYYPTISLDTSTGNLYVIWLQNILGDPTYAPVTVTGRKCVSGTWSNMTIEPQTTFTKQYMTSIYSVSGEFKICWQWTQNTTAPIEVLFDSTMIPEFGDLTLPFIGFFVIFAVCRQRSRSKDNTAD
jgi:predicted RNA-binding Zn-ribbon protein involved in translation (DUF1610 family)